MKQLNKKFVGKNTADGSALLLAVVLTSLLAIVGMMFVLSAHVEKTSTSSVAENRELNYFVKYVVSSISEQLAADVNGLTEYYDYPGNEDRWLASLEPYESGPNDYDWRQISDVTGYINRAGWTQGSVNIEIVPDHETIALDTHGDLTEQSADADGDGVSDSKWIELEVEPGERMFSCKGDNIYAAIRVIDNGGMININTAYQFDPTAGRDDIDGSTQMQINLSDIVKTGDDISEIDDARNPLGRPLSDYQDEVIWRIEDPSSDYLPFDISDELELRNRFFIDSLGFTRLEEIWTKTFLPGYPTSHLRTPYDKSGELPIWFTRVSNGSSGYYMRRHICTTYNFDRIINPEGPGLNGGKMVCVNNNALTTDLIYNAVRKAFNSITNPTMTAAEHDRIAAQLAVNIVDYNDSDANVTSYTVGGTTYYGFEAQPFISEIAVEIGADPCNPANNHFAVELYNPFDVDINLADFRLVLDDSAGTEIPLVGGLIDANGHYVIVNHTGQFTSEDLVDDGLKLSDDYIFVGPGYTCSNYNVSLARQNPVLYLDRQDTDNSWFIDANTTGYFERDDDGGHILYQTVVAVGGGSIGALNSHTVTLGGEFNLLPFDEHEFITIGEVARMLTIGPDAISTMGERLVGVTGEEQIRVDLENPDFRNIFQYLTVFDPTNDNIDNDGDALIDGNDIISPELKIAGRININTAPWFVIAQLPWMQYNAAGDTYLRAQAIVNDRAVNDAFEGIVELMRVAEMRNLAPDGDDNLDSGSPSGPDFTDDTAQDDFEERDVIFSRISNLVTVRSDVFTAYVLVRLGADGPQKRVIAIFDRSDVYPDGSGTGRTVGKVKVLAVHPVPDPR